MNFTNARTHVARGSRSSQRSVRLCLGLWTLPIAMVIAANPPKPQPRESNDLFRRLEASFTQYCADCHDDSIAKGGVDLFALPRRIQRTEDAERYLSVLNQVKADLMPPLDQRRPTPGERRKLIRDLEAVVLNSEFASHHTAKMRQPEYGNYVDHEQLFSGEITTAPFSPARIWRISPEIYDSRAGSVRRFTRTPFSYVTPKSEFRDYAATSLADRGAVETVIIAINKMVEHELIDALGGVRKTRKGEFEHEVKVKADHRHPYRPFATPGIPSPSERDRLITAEFERVQRRTPRSDELSRYRAFLDANLVEGDNREALKAILLAINLSPDAFYREELGGEQRDRHGRRRLTEVELATALAFALTDKSPHDHKLLSAALDNGDLKNREGVRSVVAKLLAMDRGLTGDFLRPNPRLMRFFRQYFGYENADDVFKDEERKRTELDLRFPPRKLAQFVVEDLDTLVQSIVRQDREVLKRLLTTDRYFVSHSGDNAQQKKIYRDYFEKKSKARKGQKQLETRLARARSKGLTPAPVAQFDYIKVYNLPHGGTRADQEWDYPLLQPVRMAHRKGVLTHPAWLWAHSTNFDNDPIHRGIWIYRKLLAGVLADVPPDVDARVPENPHQTLRQRLDVIREDACWKCHRKINPLGEAFEIFDDFGRHREVHYFDQNSREIVKRRDRPFQEKLDSGKLFTVKVDAATDLDELGVDYLGGKIRDAHELIDKLANSPRVRQSFVRHAFRFFMGRNEMLGDSRTLIAADRAYLESGGSFRALTASLLTSDSFLYRK